MSDESDIRINRIDLLNAINDLRNQVRDYRSEMNADVEGLRKDITSLNQTISMGKGAVRMLLWLGGIAGAIGTILFTALNYFRPH